MRAIKPDVNLPAMEREILSFWTKDKIFYRSLEKRKGCKEYTFYDGPPFANGLPHYGHLLANTIKDIVPRYWTMKGCYVERRFGWDCHGVPVEYEIEKRDNLKGSGSIKEIGIAEFNRRCRESVLHYAEEWQKTISRLGRWVDWNDQYRTMDRSFMESVWWVFGELHRKGFVYRGHKVVPYSWRITSVVSNFEANQNYKNTQDPSLTARFKVRGEDAYFLVWTTTPWTLVSNLALAVGPEITYVKVKSTEDGAVYYVAEPRLDAVFKQTAKDAPKYEIIKRLKGSELAGMTYEPLLPYFTGHPKSFVVLTDTYVTTEDGTGIVHQAPAYGEDDLRVCAAHGIEFVDPIDEEGRFKETIPELAGINFKEADKDIVKRLKAEQKVFRYETLVHSYPFCERTDTPLMYRAIPAWYVAVERIGAQLVENNKTINWVPDHLRDGRMGKWLENARDWAVSRNRFWGTPLPIWVCQTNDKHVEVFSSIQDLESKTKSDLPDIHKQFVDGLTYKCSECQGEMRRVPEVFDCWFESGSMPYAQLHYPFENKERFTANFPADFIAEGLDQTRGWFYTLSVLSTALFGKPAFKNVVVNGVICDETGRKMSKRHRNYTPPDELLEKYGADGARLYMVNSPILRAEDLIFSDKGVIETIRAVILPLWNAQSFLTTYAEADGWQPDARLATGHAPSTTNEMDLWLLSRLNTLMADVQEQMEYYRLYAVVPPIIRFIDELTNWYIRLSRRRFWGDEGGKMTADSRSAYETLYFVLVEFSKVFAPLAPFTSERLYLNLTDGVAGVEPSVHLCDMPTPNRKLINTSLEEQMKLAQTVTELGRSLRAKHQLKTRQPLQTLTVLTRKASDRDLISKCAPLIREELNIKNIDFSTDESSYVNLSVKPNLKALGPRLGGEMNKVRTHLLALSPTDVSNLFQTLQSQGSVDVASHALTESDFLIDRSAKDDRIIASMNDVTVLLETKLTKELIMEGLARELVNRVQNLRKDSGLEVVDRIALTIVAEGELAEAAHSFQSYIAGETLAQTYNVASKTDATFKVAVDIEGRKGEVGIAKI